MSEQRQSIQTEGITVERSDRFLSDHTWFVRDRQTGLAVGFAVDPDDFMVKWKPPPQKGWWRWLDPLGAAFDSVDRATLIGRMSGKRVVDWDALQRVATAHGNNAIQTLLAARSGGDDG